MLPYVKIDYFEGVETKKSLLASEINVLNFIKSMSNYTVLRKQEISKKSRLKVQIHETLLKINLLLEALPKTERARSESSPTIHDKKAERVETELAEIRMKLKALRGL